MCCGADSLGLGKEKGRLESITMKKIGVLTYFWSDNPGTFLQAYSIQQAYCKSLPLSKVEIINYKNFHEWWRPNLSYITPAQWKRDFTRGFKLFDSKRKHFNITKEKLFSKNPTKAWDFIKSLDYDLISVGSDTVLELWRADSSGITPFWLAPEVPSKKVMCAASARATQYSDLNERQKEFLRKSVAGFDLLGVRDIATYQLVKALGGSNEKLKIIPDPTFYYDIDHSQAEEYFNKKGITFDKPTVALHMMRQVKWAPELARIFRNNGWQVLSLRPANYADHVINDVSPFEWAGLFKFCDLVITHRFHDTVFSLKNTTPVIPFVPNRDYITKNRDSKYHSIMREFNLLETNLIESWKEQSPQAVYHKAIIAHNAHQAEAILDKLAVLKNKFSDYVVNVLRLLQQPAGRASDSSF